MFSPKIRNIVEEMCFGIEKAIVDVKDYQEKYTSFYPYSDEVPELIVLLEDFANSNPDITKLNAGLVNPSAFQDGEVVRLSISFQNELDQLADIFDDFINYTGRAFLGYKLKKEKRTYFKQAWKKFNDQFFADEVEITFRAFTYCFWFDGGGLMEKIVPEANLGLRWQGREPEAETMVAIIEKAQMSQSGGLKPYPEKHSMRPYQIIENKIVIKKTARIELAFQEARSNIEKVTMLIRLICGGGAHYSCIVADFVGNYMNSSDMTVYEPLNQLFTPMDSSKFTYPNDIEFQACWPELKVRNVEEFRFQNQKFRDFAQLLEAKGSFRYGKQYELTIKLEKILDLVQIVESTIGDFGTSNSEYINTMFQRQVETKLKTLIGLRHKYVHGQPTEINNVIATEYSNNLDALESDITSFLFFTRLTLVKAIKNPSIKSDLLDYHVKLGRGAYINGRYVKKKPVPNTKFPPLS